MTVNIKSHQPISDPPTPSWPQVLKRVRQERLLTTEELAEQLGMSPQTLRKRFSQTGSYFNVKPDKLPNGRLLWPADALEQLINS